MFSFPSVNNNVSLSPAIMDQDNHVPRFIYLLERTGESQKHISFPIVSLLLWLWVAFGGRRKSKYPEQNHTDTGRAWKLHTEWSQASDPGTILLFGDSANHCLTVSPLRGNYALWNCLPVLNWPYDYKTPNTRQQTCLNVKRRQTCRFIEGKHMATASPDDNSCSAMVVLWLGTEGTEKQATPAEEQKEHISMYIGVLWSCWLNQKRSMHTQHNDGRAFMSNSLGERSKQLLSSNLLTYYY